MTLQEIKTCPWCGGDPCFQGDGDNWQDDRRYVEMQLECCTTMFGRIGWKIAGEMSTKEREEKMKTLLIERWNDRYIPENGVINEY